MARSYVNGDNDLHFSLFGFGIGRRKTCSLVNSPLDIRIRVHIFKALSLKHHIPITFALTKAPLTFSTTSIRYFTPTRTFNPPSPESHLQSRSRIKAQTAHQTSPLKNCCNPFEIQLT